MNTSGLNSEQTFIDTPGLYVGPVGSTFINSRFARSVRSECSVEGGGMHPYPGKVNSDFRIIASKKKVLEQIERTLIPCGGFQSRLFHLLHLFLSS